MTTAAAGPQDVRADYWQARMQSSADEHQTVTGDEWNAVHRLHLLRDGDAHRDSQIDFAISCVRDLGKAEWMVRKHRDELRAKNAELEATVASLSAALEEAKARVKLVDRVCHSHHAASRVTWEGICPVCAEAGGVEFYVENERIYRALPSGDAPR